MAPAVVLLHGFTHTGASWDPVIATLSERYRAAVRLLAPDIRGHGSAGESVPVTLDAVLEDVTRLTPQRFTLAGYSMGGRLALHAALTVPHRVERLVLIGASPGIEDPEERQARRAADEDVARRMESGTIEELAEAWAATPVLSGQSPAVLEAARRDRLRNTPHGLARALRGLGTGALPSLWGRLGEVGAPVTLIVGERDAKFVAIARRMAGSLPAAEVSIVPGAGHAVHLEAPGEVARVLAAGQP